MQQELQRKRKEDAHNRAELRWLSNTLENKQEAEQRQTIQSEAQLKAILRQQQMEEKKQDTREAKLFIKDYHQIIREQRAKDIEMLKSIRTKERSQDHLVKHYEHQISLSTDSPRSMSSSSRNTSPPSPSVARTISFADSHTTWEEAGSESPTNGTSELAGPSEIANRLDIEFRIAIHSVRQAQSIETLKEAENTFLLATLTVEEKEEQERHRFIEQAQNEVEIRRLQKIFGIERAQSRKKTMSCHKQLKSTIVNKMKALHVIDGTIIEDIQG
ncbi:hypothetical protein PROFUN_05076 [Planoprotostelium fungivorum]|uniref:Uncharacterized protein n=1 Tax=Planoprotostelium fungivorum TaxID=1890364 RepID=A0A2P6NSB7_9EUKA|nr:hypothetical protein PROFUN_05076 [Planoprotostelium fungivorum]